MLPMMHGPADSHRGHADHGSQAARDGQAAWSVTATGSGRATG